MECPICLDQFSNEVDDYFVTTRNGHIFHNSCLSRVKTRTCPTCRDCSIEECDLIRLRNVDAVRSVSEKPAAENSANQEFQILSDLILLGDKERFKNFMDTSQFDAKYKDELTGKNLAHISAENGRLGILQFLRDGVGLNMDEVDGSGAKILDIALRSGHNDIVSFLVPDTSSGPLLMMDVATNPSTSTTHFEQGETPSISRSDLEQSDNEDDCRTIFIDHNPSSSFLKSASLNDQDSDYKLVIVGVGQAKPVKFQ
ncbi:Espin [Folsomia candida]|uniref:Espin n=2 Tax=Folsomia candida TaxID=158441 RepID=A0A226F4Y9_FOLCA|nr:Espin [Folsomia candida]